jgi:tRNA threonylcarbamoyl adenosine modification protein YeaZ
VRVLGISSAYGGCLACLCADGAVRAQAGSGEEHGLAAALPAMIETLLGRLEGRLDLVAVSVGPGSFSGLRAGISVATGIGLALAVPVVGVTVTEAFEAALLPLDGRPLWVAVAARRGRVFVDTGDGAAAYATDALPLATGRIAIAGNAANYVASALAAKGVDVMLTTARLPRAEHVAMVGVERAAGRKTPLTPLTPLPLYVDAPEARLPAAGLRAAPV